MLRMCPQGSVGQMAEKPRRSAFWAEKWVTPCNLLQHPWLAFAPRPSFSVAGIEGPAPNSQEGGTFHLPLHPEPLLVRCSHRQAVLPPWLCSPLLPIHWAPGHPDGACLIDSICPTVKTLRRCQAPSTPPPGSQQTPAKALRLEVLPGPLQSGCRGGL